MTPAREPPACVADQIDSSLPAALVDRVDLSEEGDGLPDAEFVGPVDERPNVLRQAAAAEAEARPQEPSADPRVVGQRFGELLDVGAGALADLGHRVDEGDLRGQEGVRGHLDQLGRRQIRHHDGDGCLEQRSEGRPPVASVPTATMTPKTSRSGRIVSSTAKPSRRNSGSTPARPGLRPVTSDWSISVSRAAVPTGTVDLPTTRQRRGQVNRERRDHLVDVREIGSGRVPSPGAFRRRRSGCHRRRRPLRCRC